MQMNCNILPYKEYDSVVLNSNSLSFGGKVSENLHSEAVSSFSKSFDWLLGSGISHGAAPTTNALNFRFRHNLRLLRSSFAINRLAN